MHKLKYCGEVNFPQLEISKLLFKKCSFLESTDPIKMQMTPGKNSTLHFPQLRRPQLEPVICGSVGTVGHHRTEGWECRG